MPTASSISMTFHSSFPGDRPFLRFPMKPTALRAATTKIKSLVLFELPAILFLEHTPHLGAFEPGFRGRIRAKVSIPESG